MACQMFIITTHVICHAQPEVGCQIMADHAVVFRPFANCLHSVIRKKYFLTTWLQRCYTKPMPNSTIFQSYCKQMKEMSLQFIRSVV